MVKKSGLGRGLDVLLSAAKTADEQTNQSVLKKLSIEQIKPGKYQPRTRIEPAALQELADSIKAQGLVQPVVVRRLKVGGYELIAGERRWRASQLAGLREIPAIVRDIPDQAAAAMALIENIQREDLNALEEANALRRLIDEFGLTHQQIGNVLGRSRATVTNLLRLIDLCDDVKALLDDRLIDMGHARALLALSSPDLQLKAARKVVQLGLSVRATEQLVKTMQNNDELENNHKIAPDVLRLERSLGERIGAKVAIRYNTKGKGKMVIEYNSLDELDGILSHIR